MPSWLRGHFILTTDYAHIYFCADAERAARKAIRRTATTYKRTHACSASRRLRFFLMVFYMLA